MYLPACQPFKLDLAWLKGQAFRWTEREGWFYGIVKGNLIKVRNAKGGIEFQSSDPEESLESDVSDYFRLNQDITPIHDKMRKASLGDLVGDYGGSRILRQDPWECLVAYACSQNNNVERITEIVERIAKRYGKPCTLDGVTHYSFPPPDRLAKVSLKELKGLSLGLNRAELIFNLATHVTEGKLSLDALTRSSYTEAMNRLMEYRGIGQKIAACVCLFSLGWDEAFPVDTHIAAGLECRYGKKYTAGAKNAGLLAWAHEKFGPHQGYASQLLFLEGWRAEGG